MPWLVAVRVVSLPATASSRKNELKSSSESFSPSTSALTSVVTMSSPGSRLARSESFEAYMNISIDASMPSRPSAAFC